MFSKHREMRSVNLCRSLLNFEPTINQGAQPQRFPGHYIRAAFFPDIYDEFSLAL